LSAIYVGAHDIAHGEAKRLRDPRYRKQYELAYQEDLKKYDGELTLDRANERLLVQSKTRPMNRYLLKPENVDGDIAIENAFELGEVVEILYGEKLPTVRLWIHFKEYIIGGVPDGITDDYVYEFKATTQSGRRVEDVKRRAVRQALIYAYAFKRPNIKVQVAHFQLPKDAFPLKVKDLPKPDVATTSRPASDDETLAILCGFDKAFHGSDE